MNRFQAAIARFDEENARDPNFESVNGERIPRELLYARRLTDWVLKLNPNASEELRLAARCQHIRRWEIDRATYPMDRGGYHRWKNRLKEHHAEVSGQILREVGYSEEVIQRVRALNLKSEFPHDPDSQTLEDGLCLVFLEFQLRDLAAKTSREKIVNALRKSWAKMSPQARQVALNLSLGETERDLIKAALP